MLEKLEMHDIQDKTRLLDEMNETREGVNKALDALKRVRATLQVLEQQFATHLKGHEAPKDTKVKK